MELMKLTLRLRGQRHLQLHHQGAVRHGKKGHAARTPRAPDRRVRPHRLRRHGAAGRGQHRDLRFPGYLLADWAKPYVAYLVSAGIVNGADGNINPKAYITRAEVAVIMYNIANELGLFSEAEEVIEVVEEETEETTEESAEETTEAAEGETVEETTEAENA